MKTWLAAALCLAATATLGNSAGAAPPLPSTGFSAWVEPGLAGSGLRAIPSLALDGPRASLIGATLLAGSERETPYHGAKLVGAFLVGPARMPLELKVAAAHRNGAALPAQALLRAEARLHFQDGRRGAWMGAATEQAHGAAMDAGDWDAPFVGFGAWARQHRMTVLLDLEQRAGILPAASGRDSVRRTDAGGLPSASGNGYLRATLTTTRATLRWEGERFEIESVAGVTLSLLREPRRWAQARAAVRVSSDLAIFATVGSRAPELYLIEPTEAPSATLGVRFSNWRSTDTDRPLVVRAAALDWRMHALGGGDWALTVRAPGARMVEVMGDFTDWQPLRLAHAGSERWEGTLSLTPGIHHVNLRVDGGEWLPPPGLPTATDGYNGTVGILVAE